MSRIRIILGVGSAVGSFTWANGEPAMPEKSRFAGGFLGTGFLMMGVVVIFRNVDERTQRIYSSRTHVKVLSLPLSSVGLGVGHLSQGLTASHEYLQAAIYIRRPAGTPA